MKLSTLCLRNLFLLAVLASANGFDCGANKLKYKGTLFEGAKYFWPLESATNLVDVISCNAVASVYGTLDSDASPENRYGIKTTGNNGIKLGVLQDSCLSDLSLCSKGMTITLWILLSTSGAPNSGDVVLATGDDTTQVANILLSTNTQHGLMLEVFARNQLYTAMLVVSRGKWYHVAITYDSNEGVVHYLDGIRFGKGTTVIAQNATGQANATALYLSYAIGRAKSKASYRDIAVWEYKLIEPEVKSIFSHIPGCYAVEPSAISWSASSADGHFQASQAGFDSLTAWCAERKMPSSVYPILQAQFSTVYKVYSLILGQKTFDTKEYVTNLNAQWSVDGEIWSACKAFTGLQSTTNMKVFPLATEPIPMRYLRLMPRSYVSPYQRACLRLKVCGYKLGPNLNITAAVRKANDVPSCSVMVNGQEYCANRPGHNLVLFNLTTGENVGSAHFDTQSNIRAGDDLAQFINSLQNGTLAVVVVKDSGHRNTPSGLIALVDLGARSASPLADQTPWVLIGRKARLEKWTIEKSGPGNEEVEVTTSIPLEIGLRESHYWPMDAFDYQTIHGLEPNSFKRNNFRDRRGNLDIIVHSFRILGGMLWSNGLGRMDTHTFNSDCITQPSSCPGGVTVSFWWRQSHAWLHRGEYQQPPVDDTAQEIQLSSPTGKIAVDRYLFPFGSQVQNGYNVVLLQYGTGRILDVQSYDMTGDATASDRFNNLIQSSSQGTVVLIAVKGTTILTSQTLIDTLKSVGARDPALASGERYTFIGYKGIDKMDWVEENKVANGNSDIRRLYLSFSRPWRSSVGLQDGKVQSWQLTSNSFHVSHPPSTARLHGQAPGWEGSAAGSYLQIELSEVTLLAGFATQGRYGGDMWVSSYFVRYAIDSNHWVTLIEHGIIAEYAGNRDQNTVMAHRFYRPLKSRLIRVVMVTYHTTPFLRAELYKLNSAHSWLENQVAEKEIETPDSPQPLLGPFPKANGISFAQTSYRDKRQKSEYGLLHNKPSDLHDGCFCAGDSTNKRMKITWKERIFVTGMAIQGRPGVAEWVTQLKVSYIKDFEDTGFIFLRSNGNVKLFNGSFDSDTAVNITFASAFYATVVRFTVTEWHQHPCLRAEIYGYPLDSACFHPLGVQQSLPDDRLSAPSSLSGFEPHLGRLHHSEAWCASTPQSSYLQIDLGEPTIVSGIATQGSASNNVWSRRFFLSHSREGLEWRNYTRDGATRVFDGNVDSSSVVVNPIYLPVTARFIRIHPLDGDSTLCLRVELYGCLKAQNPKFAIVGPAEIDAANSSDITISASYRYCLQGLSCPTCKRQIYMEVFGVVQCVVSQALYDCDYHQFDRTFRVPSYPDIYNIRVFDQIGEACEETITRTTAGQLIGRVVAKVHNARSCLDLLLLGQRKSGIYYIRRSHGGISPVYCDQNNHGGGWLVFQKRFNGSVDFYKTWNEYKQGFGSLEGEFWLGNEDIHELSTVTPVELLIEMEDFHGEYRYARYDTFQVADETSNYRLTVSGYTGTASDSFSRHTGSYFSTKDKDLDAFSGVHCAVVLTSAFWYDEKNSCKDFDPNSVYAPDGPRHQGIKWKTWKGLDAALKSVDMKIRPKQGPFTCNKWRCLYFVKGLWTWDQAAKRCRDIGAELVTITTSDENTEIVNILATHPDTPYVWIGLHDQPVENEFEWYDHSPSSYRNFHTSYNHANWDCVRLHANNGKWTVYPCSKLYGYICKRATMCHKGSCYAGTGTKTDLATLKSFCLQQGMNLVKFLDRSEEDFVRTRMSKLDWWTFIGLSDEVEENRFVWWDNSSVTRYNWRGSEPNGRTTENCAAIRLDLPGWIDVSCQWQLYQVCEKEVAWSCQELLELGAVTSGVYHIRTTDARHKPIKVFCDQENDGGGWEVILRRQDGSVNFHDKLWRDFEEGIGDVEDKEFYLGNRNMGYITRSPREIMLKITSGGATQYTRYKYFKILTDKYLWKNQYYDGGNLLTYLGHHNNFYFSTADVDNDRVTNKSCAQIYGPSWHREISIRRSEKWVRDCFTPHINIFGPWNDTVGGNPSYIYHTGISMPITYLELKMRYSYIGTARGIMSGMAYAPMAPAQGLHVSYAPHQITFRAMTAKMSWDVVCSPHQGWTHYALTWSENDGVKIYENGILVQETRFYNRNVTAGSRKNYLFGYYNTFMLGSMVYMIQRVKIWNRHLHQEEVLTEYSNGSVSLEAYGLDDWRQYTSSDFNWTVNAGCTQSVSTGPCTDNTFGHPRGSYALIEASYPNFPEKRAVLKSTTMAPAFKCFRFSLYMQGSDVGNLSVLMVGYDRDSVFYRNTKYDMVIFNKTGDQGDRWRQVELPIDTNVTFQIWITGWTGRGFKGDIAIDDMSFTTAVCNNNVSSCLPCKEGHQCIESSAKCDCGDLQFVNATCHDVLSTSSFRDTSHYWSLDDPAAVRDLTGGLHGNASTTVKLVPGAVNKALEADDQAQIIFGNLSGSCALDSNACEHGFTVSLWLQYPKNLGRERRVYLSFGHDTPSARGFQIKQDFSLIENQMHLIFEDTIANTSCMMAFPVIPTVWSSLVFIWSRVTGWSVIHNNQNLTEFIIHRCNEVTSTYPQSTLLMSGDASMHPAVVIDDLAIWDRLVAFSEVHEIFRLVVAPRNTLSLSLQFPLEQFFSRYDDQESQEFANFTYKLQQQLAMLLFKNGNFENIAIHDISNASANANQP